jgi:hypothetical protein
MLEKFNAKQYAVLREKNMLKFKYTAIPHRGAGATGTSAPVAQTLRGQHGGNRLPFLPELHLEICALFTEIGI